MLRKLRSDRKGVLYVYALIVIFIVIGAAFWFLFHYIFWMIQPVTQGIATDLNTNGTSWTQVDTFFQAYDSWGLILALFAMMIFVFVYSQRKGQEV